MNDRQALWRKLRYIAAIVALIVPLSLLSMPSSGSGTPEERSGGKLAQLRKKHNLSQTNLGEIDPASETMKLATLGMRGVAANILWRRADEYKKKEDWTNLSATLEQITKIQPNFISVWEFQAWNLSYNVSVEFDDYKDRYYWVIRGINFLKEGIDYNADNPILLNKVGWTVGQKIGRADEHVQFRKLFRADDDYHNQEDPNRTQKQRDNWLVSRLWYQRAEDVVDSGKKPLKNKGPLLFFASSAMALMNYGDALIDDGTLGDEVKIAWQNAARAWRKYGDRPVMHTFGYRVRLNDLERVEQEAAEYRAQIQDLAPETVEKLTEARLATLDPALVAAWKVPAADRTEEQGYFAEAVEREITVPLAVLADEIKKQHPESAREVDRLVRRGNQAAMVAQGTRSYRDQVNYDYWGTRAEMEQTDDALTARRLIQEGKKALSEGADLKLAQKRYEEGLKYWRNVVDRFPKVVEAGTTGDDLIEIIGEYAQILSELAIDPGDEKFPPDFPLRDVVERYDDEGKLRGLLSSPELEKSSDPTANEAAAVNVPGSTESSANNSSANNADAAYEGAPPEPVENAAP